MMIIPKYLKRAFDVPNNTRFKIELCGYTQECRVINTSVFFARKCVCGSVSEPRCFVIWGNLGLVYKKMNYLQ